MGPAAAQEAANTPRASSVRRPLRVDGATHLPLVAWRTVGTYSKINLEGATVSESAEKLGIPVIVLLSSGLVPSGVASKGPTGVRCDGS
ncbi:hypothetical protein GCM10027203_38180 [Nonomuraea fastidiosa]